MKGRPDIYDVITNGKVQLVVNTPKGDEDGPDDSYVRKACIKSRVSYITTMAAALASADGILAEQKQEKNEVVSLQELHSRIREKSKGKKGVRNMMDMREFQENWSS